MPVAEALGLAVVVVVTTRRRVAAALAVAHCRPAAVVVGILVVDVHSVPQAATVATVGVPGEGNTPEAVDPDRVPLAEGLVLTAP